MTPDERREVPGLNPERADIIVAGVAVAAEVLRRLESRELVVSRYGIREGLLLEAARVVPTIADPGRRARALGGRLRPALPRRGTALGARADARARAVRRARRTTRLQSGRSGGALRCGAATRRRLSHQLRAAPQALIPSGPPRRPARHAAVGAGGDGERLALSPWIRAAPPPPQLRHARQDAAPPDPPLVGDPSRSRTASTAAT